MGMSVHITPRLALELILVRLNSGRKKSSLDTIFFIYRFAMNEPTGRDCTVVAELQETRGVFPIFSLVSIPYPVFPSVTSQEPHDQQRTTVLHSKACHDVFKDRFIFRLNFPRMRLPQ